MVLQRQDISRTMKDVITRIKSLIRDNKVTKEEEHTGGWKYGGKELEAEIELLITAMDNDYEVLNCNVFHFVNGANIRNPTNRLLILPINGTPKLSSGELLLPENYYYAESGQLLFGDRWDIILAALGEKKAL